MKKFSTLSVPTKRVRRDTRPLIILKRLKHLYPNARCELNFNDNFQLLVATILSAQCTDIQVNKVTSFLFTKFPSINDFYNKLTVPELEKIIRPIGLFKTKAKNIKRAVEIIMNDYGGTVPSKMELLVALPGVGRKTANVVLSNGLNINMGVVVDTHVRRVSLRLGLTLEKNPLKIEQDLMKIFVTKDWGILSHLLISHGRRVCVARKPKCPECILNDCCNYGESIGESI